MKNTDVQICVIKEAFEPEQKARAFRKKYADTGAIVTFLGQVRSDNNKIEFLELEHYPEFTEATINQIANEAAMRWGVDGLVIIHRVGKLVPGDPIVFVAAASTHRRDAFAAVDFMMDYLKSEAPLWKQERISGQNRWIEPRQQDQKDKARWSAAK